MKCCRCSTTLNEAFVCETCSQFYDMTSETERRRSYLFTCICREACDTGIPWTEIDRSLELAEKYGFSHSEIDDAISYSNWHYKAPIKELTEEEQLQIKRLEERGLELHRCTSGPFRHGFIVTKPEHVDGNRRELRRSSHASAENGSRSKETKSAPAKIDSGSGVSETQTNEIASDDKQESSYADSAIQVIGSTDSPSAWLYPTFEKWTFFIGQYVPGPGPGDFANEHENLKDAVDDVLDYYFGNPERMDPYSEYSRKAYEATNPVGHRIKVPDDHENKENWLKNKTGGAF